MLDMVSHLGWKKKRRVEVDLVEVNADILLEASDLAGVADHDGALDGGERAWRTGGVVGQAVTREIARAGGGAVGRVRRDAGGTSGGRRLVRAGLAVGSTKAEDVGHVRGLVRDGGIDTTAMSACAGPRAYLGLRA